MTSFPDSLSTDDEEIKLSLDGIDIDSSFSESENMSSASGSASFNNKDNFSHVEKHYTKLTECINNDGELVVEMENLRIAHGNEVYRRTIEHIPINDPNDSNWKEPILFQLALKYDQYEKAIDKLLEDDMLNLEQTNQFDANIYNVLLFKDFHCLCQFLSFLRDRKVEHGIVYINGKDGILVHPDVPEDTETRSVPEEKAAKIDDSVSSLSNSNSGQRFLIEKGMLYCRNQVKEGKISIIKQLKLLNILHTFLTEEIENAKVYFEVLADEYPRSKCVLELIVKEDSSIILNSSFLVFLAQRNIIYFFEFLKSLMVDYKMERKALCRTCSEQIVRGKSILTIVRDNKNPKFSKTVTFIQEFLEKYNDAS